MEERFRDNKGKFEMLLADAQADPKLTSISTEMMIYAGTTFTFDGKYPRAAERLGLSEEHWAAYIARLKELGLRGGIFKTRGRVEFRMERGTLFNGDSYKGYEYFDSPPARASKSSLDSYRISSADKDEYGNWIAYKRINDHWYLYLFVNS